ncbi:bestrophin family protein [Solimonas marina]|uniref:Bestrophin n=1 Tax=Solimonas marina TaxID=2714601 RepID=A0A970B5Q0_9GAMM|nr:bestrophin family ion channel [Solimonas marina]NKF23632.1 hypothetical protein [Solimonas marina]
MIVRPRSHWLRMLFAWRGSVVYRIVPQLALVTLLALAVTLVRQRLIAHGLLLTAVPFTLLGITLAIFLGFRNTVSYDRYWEARKLWGAVLNDSRSLTRQVLTLTSAAPDERTRLVHGIIAFVQALHHELRRSDASADLTRLLAPEWQARCSGARFPSSMILLTLAEELQRWRAAGHIDAVLMIELDRTLARLTDSVGGCERIAGTPIPFAYSVLLHRTIYLYSFLLPFGLVATIGAMTPPIVAFIAYTFFALEALAEEIQDPFGTEPNDLALEAMSRNIEITLREMLGETALPDALPPVRDVLR